MASLSDLSATLMLSALQTQYDRRARKVLLTPQGRAFWDSLQPKLYEFYRQAMARFRFDDKASLLHFLNTLNTGMNSIALTKADANKP
jgi:DNA-binding MarR family transcriptional regulator